MIYDILASCRSGLDLLTVFLSWSGWSLGEIADEIGEHKSTTCRRLQSIRERLQ